MPEHVRAALPPLEEDGRARLPDPVKSETGPIPALELLKVDAKTKQITTDYAPRQQFLPYHNRTARTAATSELNQKKGPRLGPLPYAITELGLLRDFKKPPGVPTPHSFRGGRR